MIPKAKKCSKCGFDIIDVVDEDGKNVRINAQLVPYEDHKYGERLYRADGSTVRGKILWPGMTGEPDGYAHRIHSRYCDKQIKG